MLPLQFQAEFSQVCPMFSYDRVSSCTGAALKAIRMSWMCESMFSTEDCVDQLFYTAEQISDLHSFSLAAGREVCKIKGAFQEITKHTSRILLG